MLKLQQIVKDYQAGDTTVHALRGVSLQFRESEFVAILGHSGCGKTTLLNIIGGLDHYTSGDLIINGKSTKDFSDADWDSYRNHSIGFVFQSYNLIPHQTVLSNVELALTLSGVSKSERRERAKKALESVGLGDQLDKKPNQMSGGQMQRVAIARALVNDPDILLADEPTTALDVTIQGQILALLGDLSRERGMGLLLITHDLGVVAEMADEVGVMYAGRIVERAPVRALFAEPRHPYTWGLIRSAPTLDTPPSAKLDAIPGTVPSPGDLPQGCPFRPRCPEAHERCFKTPPVIESAGADGAREVCCWLAEAR